MLTQLLLVCALLVKLCLSTVTPRYQNTSAPFAVTGVRTGILSTGVSQVYPARRNIDDLCQDTPQWSLFVQALNQLQQRPEKYDLSYYGIAGIHGRPYHAWNGAPPRPGAPRAGYCTHDDVLFLTWHRPYLALYEQTLASIAQQIAKTYPSEMMPSWQTAADQLRMPFWDWASNSTMPGVVNTPQVQIMSANGMQQMVNNPLYQYTFQSFPMNETWFPTNAKDGYLANDTHTMRGVDYVGGPSNPAEVDAIMSSIDFRTNTWYALTKNTGAFNNFSTTLYGSSSLEAIHNTVHAVVGLWAGHMSQFTYSAFDPIFWLHHANIDRLYAIWQALNLNATMTPSAEPYGNFAIAAGSVEDDATPLEPFSPIGNAPYHTSDTTRWTTGLGYTYPEIPEWNLPADRLSASVAKQIYDLYGPTTTYTLRKRSTTDTIKQWFARIQVDKLELQGERFYIRLFLNHVPQDPVLWSKSANQMGLMTIFPPPPPGRGSTQALAYSEFSLTEAMLANGVQDIQDDTVVKEYLKQHLHWRVQLFNGTRVASDKVSSLVVDVHCQMVTVGDRTKLPRYSGAIAVPDVTVGQSGGMSG